MSGKGAKRASPGADDEKATSSLNVQLDEKAVMKLDAIRRESGKIELFIEREAQKKYDPVFQKRRPIVKATPNFWPVALLNHSVFAIHIQHNADQNALSYLEDVWVSRDPKEHRCFTLEFHFKENPYFKNKVLKRAYKYKELKQDPSTPEKYVPDENGVTDAQLDFDWSRDVELSGTKIEWKSDEKNLVKSYPSVKYEDDDDDDIAESGSFFNFFEHDEDPSDLGPLIANEVFPEAIEYFLGLKHDEYGINSEEEEDSEDDDDSDAEEIDLEKPSSKKRRV